jgi:hypothetical protein
MRKHGDGKTETTACLDAKVAKDVAELRKRTSEPAPVPQQLMHL